MATSDFCAGVSCGVVAFVFSREFLASWLGIGGLNGLFTRDETERPDSLSQDGASGEDWLQAEFTLRTTADEGNVYENAFSAGSPHSDSNCSTEWNRIKLINRLWPRRNPPTFTLLLVVPASNHSPSRLSGRYFRPNISPTRLGRADLNRDNGDNNSVKRVSAPERCPFPAHSGCHFWKEFLSKQIRCQDLGCACSGR